MCIRDRKNPPFEVLYDYGYAGGLAVAGSEQACLELVLFALEKGLSLGVHYLSLIHILLKASRCFAARVGATAEASARHKWSYAKARLYESHRVSFLGKIMCVAASA